MSVLIKNDAIQRVCLYLATALISFLAMFREYPVSLWLPARPHVYSAMTGFTLSELLLANCIPHARYGEEEVDIAAVQAAVALVILLMARTVTSGAKEATRIPYVATTAAAPTPYSC